MHPENGWCGRQGRWVNALSEAPRKCFDDGSNNDRYMYSHTRAKPAEKRPKRKRRVGGAEVPEGHKYCPTCGRILPHASFSLCKGRGYAWECKECAAARTRRYKAKLREQ